MKKATSLQRSLSCESESNRITKLDHINALPLMYGQGFNTLPSDPHARYRVFFCACKNLILRVLSEIQNSFEGNTGSSSWAVLKHPILFKYQFNVNQGGYHA